MPQRTSLSLLLDVSLLGGQESIRLAPTGCFG